MNPHKIETEIRQNAPSPPEGWLSSLEKAAVAEGLLDLAYCQMDTPVGELTIVRSQRGLALVAFPETPLEETLQLVSERISPRVLEAPAQLDEERRELDEFFAGERSQFELSTDLALATPFTQSVLSAAQQIPYGATSSYARVAEMVGAPRASRAVGSALGANPIPIVIPCHRVLRSDGSMGGYAGGLERKRDLLELEQRSSTEI